jgi:hypothetical protein
MELTHIDTHIVDHCNLNCKGCGHFAPLAEKTFVDINVFRKDFLRLRQLFNNIRVICLMGGEPLLHPQLISFLELTRSVFNNSQIWLTTNGTLLLGQPDIFWEKCSENNIIIHIPRYPIKLDFEKIEKTAEKFHVAIDLNRTMIHFLKIINIEGNSNSTKSFQHCRSKLKCYFLRDGKIYLCGFPANLHIFNKYFQKNIPVTEADYMNIHDNVSGTDIVNFLDSPKPICSFCLVKWPTFKWGFSEKRQSEWTLTLSDKFAYKLNLKRFF